jgi:DNA-directed RNA polymerase alpha subunit
MNPIFKKDRSTTHSLTLNQKSDTVLAKQNYQSDPRILNLDIGNLDLTLAPYSLLKQANINTINDLISYSKQQILEIPNFGQRWLNQIEDALLDLNLKPKIKFLNFISSQSAVCLNKLKLVIRF